MKIILIIIVLVLPHVAGCVSMEDSLDKAARSFVGAVLEKDKKRVVEMLGSHAKYLWDTDNAGYSATNFWDDKDREDFSKGYKTAQEIFGLDDLEIQKHPQSNSQYIIFFVPKQYVPKDKNSEFYSEEWSRKYFACWFGLEDGEWKIIHNVCFAETDGPYGSD